MAPLGTMYVSETGVGILLKLKNLFKILSIVSLIFSLGCTETFTAATDTTKKNGSPDSATDDNVDEIPNIDPDPDPEPQPEPISVVNKRISITPTASTTTSDFIAETYKIVLNRKYDKSGFKYAKTLIESGQMSRLAFYHRTATSAEVIVNKLTNKNFMIVRAYSVILNRPPSSDETLTWSNKIKAHDDSGDEPLSWYDFYNALKASPEYEGKTCHSSYLTYDQPIKTDSPTLNDVFAGRAEFEPVSKAEAIHLDFNTVTLNVWDQKLPIVYDQTTGKYVGFTRAYVNVGTFNIVALTSDDGLSFQQIGDEPIFTHNNGRTFYDPQITIDHSTCPKQYIMAMECPSPTYGVSLCTSYSTTPSIPESWSVPVEVVVTSSGPGHPSASTGTVLADGHNKYTSWTVVDDGNITNIDEGHESTYTKGVATDNFSKFLGSSLTTGEYLMAAEKNINCTNSWDCNNRDQQDWKKEGEYFYNIYNGANYYRCVRPNNGNSFWSLAMRRSKTPIGEYKESTGPLISATRNDTCGISYSTINTINGELYMYYALYPTSGGNLTLRSKLVWK